jgi:hypothetical protein
LIDQTGQPRLADFGLLTIVSDPSNFISSSSCTQDGTVRWMGPECIFPQEFGFKDSRPTKSSDCYSLGMVIYETISGNPPFHEYADMSVFLKVLKGEHPSRGVEFTEGLWGMLERCWMFQPNSRPGVEDVLQYLESVLNGSELPSSKTSLISEEGDLQDSPPISTDTILSDWIQPTIHLSRKIYETVCHIWFSSGTPSSHRNIFPSRSSVSTAPLPVIAFSVTELPYVQSVLEVLETTQLPQSTIPLSLYYIYCAKEQDQLTGSELFESGPFRVTIVAMMIADQFLNEYV